MMTRFMVLFNAAVCALNVALFASPIGHPINLGVGVFVGLLALIMAVDPT